MAVETLPTIDEALAVRYAEDLMHGGLLEAGEPVKASEAARLSGEKSVDLKLGRVILASNPKRFASTDRKWTVWTRFAGPDRATERNLDETLNNYGLPAHRDALARELAAIYGRPVEIYEVMLERMLANRDRYFPASDGRVGLTRWLLDTSSESEEDVLFDNYLTEADVARFAADAGKLSASDLDGIIKFLDKVKEPVPNKLLQFYIWRSNPLRFNAVTLFNNLLKDGRAVYLSSGEWLGPKAVEKLKGFFKSIAEREVDEYGEQKAAETQIPLVVTEEDKSQLVQRVLKSEGSSRAAKLLEEIFEVTPGESTYDQDLASVINALRNDEQVVWVGADRFVPKGSIPEYVFSVPELLHFNITHYTDAEGNEVDLVLEDDGFDGGLQREILSPLAQDVLDEELVFDPEPNPPVTTRCVLKFHHKEIGTLPLCQFASGFFPVDAPVVQADVILPSGQAAEVWVNNEARLLFGLLDWYHMLPVDSGAVFYLERQAPDRYLLTYGEETEPAMFISRNRVNELMELGQRAEDEELPTFDILREIMEHYRKGIDYLTLLTEVNIARRTPRRMVASLLSGFHCFFQRGGAWVFDAKKLSQGFDRSKRKYLKK